MTTENKTIFEKALETQLLTEALRKAGDFVSYDDLTKACGRDVTKDGRGNLYSAKRIVQREDRVVWGTVPKKGLQRLRGEGLVAAGASSLSRIHSEARRGVKRLECVTYEELDNSQRIKHNATAAALGALGALTKTTSLNRIEQASEKTTEKLSMAETLRLFGAS